MTNSKKDSELEEILLNDSSFQHILKFAPKSQRGLMTSELARYISTNYITKEESDRRVLEANSKLLDALENHKKTLDYIVKDGAPRNPTNYEVYLRKAIEVDGHRAELRELLDRGKDGL